MTSSELRRAPLAFFRRLTGSSKPGDDTLMSTYRDRYLEDFTPDELAWFRRPITRLLVFCLAMFTSCVYDPPTCAELGCPDAPSGDPDHWEPCAADECYCPTDVGPIACEQS